MELLDPLGSLTISEKLLIGNSMIRRIQQTAYVNKLLAHIEQITSEGVRLPSNIAAMILLKAVPRHWDNFASMILATTATSVLGLRPNTQSQSYEERE